MEEETDNGKVVQLDGGKILNLFYLVFFFFTLEQCRKYFKVILKIDVNDVFSTTLLLTLNRFRMLLCCVHR